MIFRAYPHPEGAPGEVVVEYWFYYTHNDYQGTRGLFFVGSDVSHPNDMEHIFLVLAPTPPRTGQGDPSPDEYRIVKILCGAHEINNVLHFESGDSLQGHLDFLVELGSHATCPDVDRDGQYTPGVDGQRRQKYCWGLRDRGRPWAWWRAADADPRVGDHAIRMREETDGTADSPEWAAAIRYRLEADSALEEAYRHLAATNPESARLADGPSSRFKHFFGLADASDRRLWMPAYHENYGNPERLERNFTSRERGLTIGYTRFIDDYTLALGTRWGICMGRGVLPDVILDGQMFITGSGSDYYSAEAAAYYPLDRISNVFAGGGVLADNWTWRDAQSYAVAGLEVRLGHFRVRGAYRTGGRVSRDQIDFRFSYLFAWERFGRRNAITK